MCRVNISAVRAHQIGFLKGWGEQEHAGAPPRTLRHSLINKSLSVKGQGTGGTKMARFEKDKYGEMGMNYNTISKAVRVRRLSGGRRIWTASASVLALGLFAGLGVGRAGAQTMTATAQPQTGAAAGSAAAPSPAGSGNTVGEVVVTAERRSVNIQTTPISVAAVAGNTLQEKQVVTIQDLQTSVPGLSVTESGQTTNVNIRGLGNSAITPSITTGVAVFRDGLYEPEAILLNEPFYDVADVEVERGPQGTIIGQNSTGGAVQINSRNPNFIGINGYMEGTVGNYANRRLDGAVNLPLITDVLAARVAFNVEGRDSYYNDVGQALNGSVLSNDRPGSVSENNVRIGLLFRPTESFQALFKAELNYLDTGGIPGRPLPPPTCNIAGSGCITPSNTPASFYSDGNYANLGPYNLNYNHQEEEIDRADRFGLELRYKLADGITLRSLTGYQHLDQQLQQDVDKSFTLPIANPNPGGPAPSSSLIGGYTYHEVGPLDDYYSQEFDLISPDTGKLTYLAGASYFWRSTPVDLLQYPDIVGVSPNPACAPNPAAAACGGTPLSAGGIPSIYGAEVSSLQLTGIQRLFGIFGQVSYQLLPTLQLQVGARFSMDNNQQGGYTYFQTSPDTVSSFPVSIAGHYSKNAPTWKVALNWTPMHGQFFYAFFARGFKDGGVNTGVPDFKPEYVNDYEAGWKARLLDGHLQTQLGGYYIQYEDLQYQVLVPTTTQTGNNIVNLGNSTIYGIEASGQARFGALTIDAGLEYNHSALGQISSVATYELPGQGSNGLGPQCAVTAGVCSGPGFNYNPYIVTTSGEQNPYAPEITGNVTVSYAIPMGPGTLTPRADFSYTSRQYASIFQNSNFYLLDVRHLVDAYLTYAVGDWQGELFARNLTNQIYEGGISSTNDVFYGAPRTYGVRIQRNF
jgi:iron complex outermembrane receptor protein